MATPMATMLLEAIARARAERDAADERLRRLLAYGREFHGRRGVPLRALGGAAGIARSNVATAYDRRDVEAGAALLEVPAPPTRPSPATG